MSNASVYHSTLEDWSSSYKGEKFHAVLCDPPYGLKFMAKTWDVISANRWADALCPHLLPGAIVFMFGGTRTWHKLAVGMEMGGFEIWDTLMWLYGTGFPKGQDISKLIDKQNGNERTVLGTSPNWRDSKRDYAYDAWQVRGKNAGKITAPANEISAAWAGHKTCALKPAWEPILAFRLPVKQTYAELALEGGGGALNIDGSRIAYQSEGDKASATPQGICTSKNVGSIGAEPDAGRDESRVTFERPEQLGRYPANLLLECSCDTTELVAVKGSGSVSGNEPSHTGAENTVAYGEFKRVPFTAFPKVAQLHNATCIAGQLDAQASGVSRFFYCSKASSSERNAGCGKNSHPTVKPLALTEYLAKLLLPPTSVKPRRLLVPFSGSGSEILGALRAGWDEIVGIEQEQEYVALSEARIATAVNA